MSLTVVPICKTATVSHTTYLVKSTICHDSETLHILFQYGWLSCL